MRARIAALLMTTVLLAGTITSCDDDDDDDKANNKTYTISGSANGTQVVPSVTGTGSGTISGTYDPKTRKLDYTSNWNGLTGAPMSGGFYSGTSGASGTSVGTPWTFASGSTGTGMTSGSMTLTEAQAQEFLGGNWYYSYGTSSNPGGEVRGQITATQASN